MQYRVRAIDAAQAIQTLELDAYDEADARQQALARQLTPLSVARGAMRAGRPQRRFALLLFAQELLALLNAGLSVIEALEALVEKDADAARRAVLSRLAMQLREGHRLSAAMLRQPEVFPPLFVGIVQAAENTSDLPRALARYLDYESRAQAVRHKVVSAAIYPTILLVAGGAVSLFLLGYVVPRFAAVYQGSGRELPWASQLLMQWGLLVRTHALSLAGTGLVGAMLLAWQVRRSVGAGGWLQLLRWLPGAAPKLRILSLSRLYLTAGMLLAGGIALPQALRLCAAVIAPGDAPALEAVRRRIEAGEPLSDALEQQGLGTPVALRLLRVGEQSGELGEMLLRTAAFYDEEVTRWIERFSRAFEPVLMAAIGLVVGLIVILLYMPIFELAGSLR
jgi:general secretion pathway protein F